MFEIPAFLFTFRSFVALPIEIIAENFRIVRPRLLRPRTIPPPPCVSFRPTTASSSIHRPPPRRGSSTFACLSRFIRVAHPASPRVPSRKEGGSVLFCGSASENRSRSRRGGRKGERRNLLLSVSILLRPTLHGVSSDVYNACTRGANHLVSLSLSLGSHCSFAYAGEYRSGN